MLPVYFFSTKIHLELALTCFPEFPVGSFNGVRSLFILGTFLRLCFLSVSSIYYFSSTVLFFQSYICWVF